MTGRKVEALARREVDPRGACPSCGAELKRIGTEPGTGKYRYGCMNPERSDRRRFNRFGEPR